MNDTSPGMQCNAGYAFTYAKMILDLIINPIHHKLCVSVIHNT